MLLQRLILLFLKKVAVDVVRGKTQLSVPLPGDGTGYRANSADIYTNNTYDFIQYGEDGNISSNELNDRLPGQSPTDAVNQIVNAEYLSMKLVGGIESKLRNSIEEQASQVLQTGLISLTDAAGNVVASADFKPKASHFPTVSSPWTGASDKITDLATLATQIFRDGKQRVTDLIFGSAAFLNFINDSAVQALFDNRRYELGEISPIAQAGGTYQGRIAIVDNNVRVWTYDGFRENVQTNVAESYIDTNKVILLSEASRFEGFFQLKTDIAEVYGSPASMQILDRIPQNIVNTGGNIGLNLRAGFDRRANNAWVRVEMGALMVPVSIDTYGCLTTV